MKKVTFQTQLKRMAGIEAVKFVRSGMVLGLGTGSTARFAMEEIARKIDSGELKDIVGIPSSVRTEMVARNLGIPLTTFDEYQQIDITIDGADEVDSELNLIKGGGGALLREKVLAQASRRNIIVVDESKLSSKLGTKWALPVEVIPFAWKLEYKFLTNLGAKVSLRESYDGEPYVADESNFILDCDFGQISNPEKLAFELTQRGGIVEHGLFLETTTDVLVASKNGVRYLKRDNNKIE